MSVPVDPFSGYVGVFFFERSLHSGRLGGEGAWVYGLSLNAPTF